ncbi:MAG: hypothetical protein ACTSP4_00865 [Candidatus Hodarchaeales archaeon]
MKVSDNFIMAMNGILNGEKWYRKKFMFDTAYPYIYLCVNLSSEKITRAISPDNEETYSITSEDMTATDWVKVK